MVSDSGGENAADDGPRPLESGREDNRQQLSLVADLGERNHDSGCEQGFHEQFISGSGGARIQRASRPPPNPSEDAMPLVSSERCPRSLRTTASRPRLLNRRSVQKSGRLTTHPMTIAWKRLKYTDTTAVPDME